MESSTKFILDIVLILLFTNVGSILASKFRQPAVLGQILAGLLIGPAVLGLVDQTEFVANFAEIGVLFLMFMAGMETDIYELKRSAGSSTLIAIGGMAVPFLLGFLAVKVMFTQQGTYEAIYTGVILTATSISITVQALREFNKIKDKTGVNILGAAIIDDVLGIVLLTVVTGMANPSQGGSGALMVVAKIVVFFIIAIIVGKILLVIMNRYAKKWASYISPTTIALICCFIFAYVADMFEIATIIGAYSCGIIFSMIQNNRQVDHDFNVIGYTVFTPVFFANIGLGVSFENMGSVMLPAIAIIVAAIVGKILGAGLGAKLSRFTSRESVQIGVGMIPRGEVALIIANLGKNAGIINDAIFTSIILMTVVSTLLTPILLKKAYGLKTEVKHVPKPTK